VAMKPDRSRLMKDAWLRFRQGQRHDLGWTFAQCLSTAWRAEKIRCSDAYQNEYRRAA
jgi:hypothetical protein